LRLLAARLRHIETYIQIPEKAKNTIGFRADEALWHNRLGLLSLFLAEYLTPDRNLAEDTRHRDPQAEDPEQQGKPAVPFTHEIKLLSDRREHTPRRRSTDGQVAFCRGL